MARVHRSAYGVLFKRRSEVEPSDCSLVNKLGEEITTIQSRIEAFLDGLYNDPTPIPSPDSPGLLTV